jgi:hypothetical protein
VTAVSEGTAIITAETDDYSVTCTVTVKSVADGIGQTTIEGDALEIYDLTGRPVKLDAKSLKGLDSGIYIINGRKTVVK